MSCLREAVDKYTHLHGRISVVLAGQQYASGIGSRLRDPLEGPLRLSKLAERVE